MSTKERIERLKSKGNIEKFSDFAELIETTFNKFQLNSNNEILKEVSFKTEYPNNTHPKDLDLPCITYKMKERERGDYDIKRRHREYVDDQNNPGHFIKIDGKIFKAKVVFDVWARSNKEADAISEEFEDFIERIIGLLKEKGVQEILFEKQEYDDEGMDWGDSVAHRIVNYEVYLEKLFITSTKELEDIGLDIEVTEKIKEE